MYGSNFNTHILGATQFTVTVDEPLLRKAGERENWLSFKHFSGGSLGIVNGESGGMAGAYVLDTTEYVTINGPSEFYLSATTADAVVHMLIGKTSGATHG